MIRKNPKETSPKEPIKTVPVLGIEDIEYVEIESNLYAYVAYNANGPLYISTNIESIKEYSKRTKAKDVKYKKIKFKL